MLRISKEDKVYLLNGSNKPALEAKTGESVIFETYDCFTGKIKSKEDKFTDLGWGNINPATGPLSIVGSEPGDVLVASIDKISVNNIGVMVTAPGFGVIPNEITKESTTIVEIKDNKAFFNKELQIPIEPMIGVIGTTIKGEDIPTGTPGLHGGNMDCVKIKENSKVYLPVNHKGGLLALGDLHALMADGEISMTGLEVGGEVTLKCDLLKGKLDHLPLPMINDSENLIIIHSEKTIEKAIENATSKTVRFLEKFSNKKIEKEEGLRLLSLVGQVRICQVVDPLMTVRIEIPWNILNSIGITEDSI